MSRSYARISLLAASLLIASSCSPGGSSGSPKLGSQTNWLRTCSVSSDCDGLECLCGICTKPCSEGARCGAEVDGSACLDPDTPASVAACDGRPPSTGLCLPPCDDSLCPEGSTCVLGSCLPEPLPKVTVSLDPGEKEQTLIGLGASLAYDEDTIENSPLREDLLDAMFDGSGLRMVRLRNRFEGDNHEALARTASLLNRIEDRLGSPPVLYMTSGSPPGELKENGSRYCAQSEVTCTLRRTPEGAFDYAAFGEFWRRSLEAYAEAGITPDYLSIQNHPNWVPPSDEANEACRFLDTEGKENVTLPDGSVVAAEFPGYAEALAAVREATAPLREYSFTGSETLSGLPNYLMKTDSAHLDALSVIFYSVRPEEPDLDLLEQVHNYAESLDKPVLQTEVSAAGFETSLLIHHALSALGASAYLQASFLGEEISDTSGAVVGTDGEQVARLPVFHSLTHYSRFIDVGWERILASSTDPELLVTAWQDPKGEHTSIVLINQGNQSEVVALEGESSLLREARVVRTTFDGVERSLELGALPENRALRIPSRAIVTVTNHE